MAMAMAAAAMQRMTRLDSFDFSNACSWRGLWSRGHLEKGIGGGAGSSGLKGWATSAKPANRRLCNLAAVALTG